MSKRTLAMMSVSMLLLAACTSTTTPSDDTASDGSDEPIVIDDTNEINDDTQNSDNADDASSSSKAAGVTFSAAAIVAPSSVAAVKPVTQARVVIIAVTTWSFTPAMITAQKGEKVQLKLVGGEGIHSFAVPGLNMNVRIAAGETVIVDLPTDTAGTFEAMCRIPCGAGHKEMKATVVIS